jgi:hypothetical protein
MNEDKIFRELEELLGKLSIKIKYGKGYFKGGLCRYREEQYIYLNRTENKEKHISLIISELEKMDLTGIDLSQTVEEILLKSEA